MKVHGLHAAVTATLIALFVLSSPAKAAAGGPSGRLSGTVVNQEGTPVGELTLSFASTDDPNLPARTLKVSKSGTFSHGFFPAGNYAISLKDDSRFIKSMTYVVKDENGIEITRLEGDADPVKGLASFLVPAAHKVELKLTLASAAYREELKASISTAEAIGPLKKIKELYDAGDMPGVVTASNTFLKDHPDSGLGYYLLGLAQSRTGNQTEAVASLRKALSLVPEQQGVAGALGTALLQQSKSPEVAAEAAGLLKDEMDRFGPSVPFLANRAAALEAAGDKDAFVPALEALVQADPGNVPALLQLVAIRTRAGRFDDALALLDGAPKTEPKDLAMANYNVAAGLFNGGDTDKAIATARKAIALDPALPAPYRLLGFAYASKGDKPAAIENVKRFLALAPNDPEADAEKKLLEQLQR